MDKPLISKETGRLLFDLGIQVLRTMKEIYELKSEGSLTDDNTAKDTGRDNKKDSSISDRNTDT
jgi:hypothetical protein